MSLAQQFRDLATFFKYGGELILIEDEGQMKAVMRISVDALFRHKFNGVGRGKYASTAIKRACGVIAGQIETSRRQNKQNPTLKELADSLMVRWVCGSGKDVSDSLRQLYTEHLEQKRKKSASDVDSA